jgi:hypothetical protein
MDLFWVWGPTLTRAKVEFPSKRIKNIFFSRKVFLALDAQKLGTGDLGTGPPATSNFGNYRGGDSKAFISL